jgi:hypothetical protein
MQTKTNFTAAEKEELVLLYEFITKLEKASDEELNDLALNEIKKKQPAIQTLTHHLYLSKKFNMEQMMEITRLMILVWWYYKPWLKNENKKIDEPLYVAMKEKMVAFERKMEGKSRADNRQMMDEMLEKYPARLLYGQLHRIIFMEKNNGFSTLSKTNKAYLLTYIHIIMDCFEALIDRSISAVNLN